MFHLLIRPTTALNDGSRCKGHDDLTGLLGDIVKSNNKFKKCREEGKSTNEAFEQLTVHLATYFDKDGGATTQITNLGGTGVAQPAVGHRALGTGAESRKATCWKNGRFRGTITGKRVDFTNRSVITPEPHLDIWELSVPQHVARTQTVQRRVRLSGRVPSCMCSSETLPRQQCPLCHSCRWDDRAPRHGDRSNLNIIAQALEVGWVVRRHIRDGIRDSSIVSRVYIKSMMGHSFRIHKHRTFGLPTAVTPPYNADFDGDEMNLHHAILAGELR